MKKYFVLSLISVITLMAIVAFVPVQSYAQVTAGQSVQNEQHQSFFQKLFQNVLGWIFGHDTQKTGNITVSTTEVSKDSPKNDNRKDWLTYSNFGFKIQYPQNLNKELGSEYYCAGRSDCEGTGDALYLYNYTADKDEYDKLRKNLNNNEFRVRADISVENGNINLDSIVPTYDEAHDKVVSQRIVLNGFNAAVIKNEWGYPIIYYLVNKNVKVIIYVAYTNVDQNTKDIIQKIVSSVSFTN